ncbi:hypothetical protein POM88_021868 [Heracleum sosnowskyi]|uniref:Reverse transcriptase zinc-binding domain-containing protein n=1 Tax=Heracleum sosnowskyi TaxID=360622 RepID=A0AAD8IGP5_9APIA|nr:hypothetical protein POM88_021868 [Heracleum sosnowskyi]
MWKLHHGILPVKALLQSRMRNSLATQNCCRCLDTETELHLFWQCPFAIDIWKWLFEWWGLPSFRIGSDIPTMWDSFRCFEERITKRFGKLHWVLVSGQFGWKEIKWCLAAGFLVKDTLTWWNINSMGCITRSISLKKMDLLNNGCALTGFIGGSWKLDNKGEIVAGIGGLILKQEC